MTLCDIKKLTERAFVLAAIVVIVVPLFVTPIHASAQEEEVKCNDTVRGEEQGKCPSECPAKLRNVGQGSIYICTKPIDIPGVPNTIEDFQEIGNIILSSVGFLFLALTSLILGIAGVALNLSVKFTILEMSQLINSVGAIDVAWTLIRDVANIAFIFIVLIIAISLILRVGKFNSRALLVRVIVAALLINFSFFFTRVIIDASNIITIELYQPLAAVDQEAQTTIEEEGGDEDDAQQISFFGISGAFVNEIGVLGVHDVKDFDEFSNVVRQFMGGIFMLIGAFVFLLAAILLIVRFVLFVLLLITSPIAWLGMFLPAMKQYADKWWKTMLDQAFFAPILMLMFTLSYLVISDNNFEAIITGGASPDASLGRAFQGSPEAIPIVLNFIVGIGFLMASIIVAKSMASTGSGSAVKWASQKAGRATFGAAAWTGRQTVGRFGRYASDPKTRLGGRISTLAGSDNLIARNIGRTFSRGADKIQKSSFDTAGVVGTAGVDTGKAQKGGFEKIRKDKAKRETEYIKQAGEARGEQAVRKDIRDKKKDMKEAKREMRATSTEEARERAQERLDRAQERLGTTDTGMHEKRLATLARSLSTAKVDQTLKYLALETKREKEGDKFSAEDQQKLDDIKGTLNKQQMNYAESTDDLAKAQKATGELTRAGKEKEAERNLGSFSGPRREAAQKARKELRKNEDKKLLDRLKKLAKDAEKGDKKDEGDKKDT